MATFITSKPKDALPDTGITEKIAAELFKIVCRNGGTMEVTQVPPLLSPDGVQYVDKYGFYPLIQSSFQNVLKLEVDRSSSRANLRAVVNVEVCPDYKKSKCKSSSCARLHICYFFVKGDCRFKGTCRYRHNFEDSREQNILARHKLDCLEDSSLLALLRQALIGSGSGSAENPQVCAQYNSASGCPEGSACPKLHLCSWFAKGTCKFKARCKKSHALDEENARVVRNAKAKQQQVTTEKIQRALSVAKAREVAGLRPSPPTIDEICGFHLKGNCRYGSSCPRYWNKLPYLWQIQVSCMGKTEKWFDFPSSHNQEIERDYCNVNKETSLEINVGDQQQCFLRIHFEDMAAKGEAGNSVACIRRLSTPSWLKASPGDSYATHWAWNWTNDHGQWSPYDGADVLTTSSSCDSSNEKLEESYVSGADSCVLSLKQQNYKIDFRSMVQTNIETGKARRIRRRPSIFISEQDLPGIASRTIARQRSQPSSTSRDIITALPREWAPMTDDQEVVMVLLNPGSEEFLRGQREFVKTMRGKTIHKMERVQNADLYETYTRKLSKLSRKLGRPPEERHLFHGTSDDSSKAICQQGFDWRLCGVHGTSYGKGSYFAVQASYSDGYAGTSSQGYKLMFLCKVIVGSYAAGNVNTVRPPPRDPTRPHELHHSCVDQMSNPSIFVIFDNDQAYPEFLIGYS